MRGSGLAKPQPSEVTTTSKKRAIPDGGEPRALHAVDAVGHDAEPVALAESLEHAPAAGQPVAPRREPVEVDLAETPRAPCVGADLQQQLAEALARERGL